jgi:hypothetical protein
MSTAQNTEFSSDLVVQESCKSGALKHYCAVAIIVASIPVTIAWIAFLGWLVLRIFRVL